MNCDFVVEKIDDYFDGQLGKIEQESFTAHLLGCNSCQMLVEDYQIIKEIMQDMPMMPLPNDFNETLHSKLVIAAEELKLEKAKMERQNAKKIMPFPIVAKTLMPYVAVAAVLAIIVVSGNKVKDSIWFKGQGVEQASAKIEVQKPLIVTTAPIVVAAAPIVEVANATQVESSNVEKSATEISTIKTAAPKKKLIKATSQLASLDSKVAAPIESASVQTAPAQTQIAPPVASMRMMSSPVTTSSPETVQTTNASIKHEDINLEIVNYQAFYLSIEGLMNQVDGIIESSFSELLPATDKEVAISTPLTGYVILKVPSIKVETVLEEIKKMGVLQPGQVSNESDSQESLLKVQGNQNGLTTLYIGVEEGSKNEN